MNFKGIYVICSRGEHSYIMINKFDIFLFLLLIFKLQKPYIFVLHFSFHEFSHLNRLYLFKLFLMVYRTALRAPTVSVGDFVLLVDRR